MASLALVAFDTATGLNFTTVTHFHQIPNHLPGLCKFARVISVQHSIASCREAFWQEASAGTWERNYICKANQDTLLSRANAQLAVVCFHSSRFPYTVLYKPSFAMFQSSFFGHSGLITPVCYTMASEVDLQSGQSGQNPVLSARTAWPWNESETSSPFSQVP